MPRDLILGTAGHIDHGKTALVKALTGIDCDRLPEEKKRGITIDIGFASLDLGDYRLGIVDVPGHERFIKNMLAGATSIDLALLVVSAGESIKPQTREHLEILRLLGLRHGVIALTKIDLVDETTREVVAMEIRDLVAGTFLQDAPIVPTSAFSGEGIDALKEALRSECAKVSLNQDTEWFRMAIDRSFVVQGHGTVVTGSVTSGHLKAGEEVEWLPRMERVKARTMHNHDTPVEEVRRGQRAAVNLAGIGHDDVKRGQEIATPGFLIPSRILTVRLHTLAENRRPIKHRAPARLHIGTAEAMATLSLLGLRRHRAGRLGPGPALSRLEPVMAVWGQPFVLRDSSAEHTLGGGQVLQPTALKVRRRHIEMLERIEKLWDDRPAIRAETVAWFGGWRGFTIADLVRGAGFGPDQATAVIGEHRAGGKLVEVPTAGGKALLHVDRLAELEGRMLEVLGRLHEDTPLLTSHDRQKTLSLLDYVHDDGVLQGAVDHLIKRAENYRRRPGEIARADFKPRLSANQRKLKDKVVETHRTAAFQPPEPSSFAPQAGGNAAALGDIFEVAIAEGLLVRITEDIFLHADVEADMRKKLGEKLKLQPAGLTVAEIRDLLGTTRKYAVPLCEYLDRTGTTRREGDLRVSGLRDE